MDSAFEHIPAELGMKFSVGIDLSVTEPVLLLYSNGDGHEMEYDGIWVGYEVL